MKPLSSQKGLGSTKWLLHSHFSEQAETLGAVYGVKLADLFFGFAKGGGVMRSIMQCYVKSG